jgi:electron transfer flavoprotein beta subunit
MEIIVCCKQIIDPEAPPSSYKIDSDAKKVYAASGVGQVISPFDLQAVEAALRLKDRTGAKVSVLSLGNKLQRDVLKKPLSMGADELYMVEDETMENLDGWNTAHALSLAIKKIGNFNLIICGRQAADFDSGQTGIGIAEFLKIPCITVAREIETDENKLTVKRVLSDGYETVESTLPALVTVSNELGEPRLTTLKGIMAATKKQPVIWRPADIGLDTSTAEFQEGQVKIIELLQPSREAECEMIEGESAAEIGINLALALRKAKIV